MKTFKPVTFLLSVIAIIFSSCDNKDEIEPSYENIIKKDTITTTIDDLVFKLFPLSDNEFRLTVLYDEAKTYELELKSDTGSVLTTEISNINLYSSMYADVTYSFNPNIAYTIIIRAVHEEGNTLLREEFPIYNYRHEFKNSFTYEKLTDIKQLLDFDISPSHDVIFFEDYVNNKQILKRLWLASGDVEVLDPDFSSLLLRSMDSSRLIVGTGFFDNRYLGKDSVAILSQDINTGEQHFIEWGSGDYGRYSRIVNNNLFVSNPVASGTITRINLSDGTKQKYPADIRYLREYCFDNVYLANEVYNFSSSEFENVIPALNFSSSLDYYDKASGYAIVEESFREDQQSDYYSRFLILKENNVVYEQNFEKGLVVQFPRIIDFSSGKIVFYKGYDFSNKVRFDGYYALDLKTGKVELKQTDNKEYNYVKRDFFLENGSSSFISVRPWGIYRIKMF